MPYGPVTIYSTSIASAASTAYFNLDKSWSKVMLQLPSLSTNAECTIFGSADGTTWKNVYERVNTATCQFQTMIIGSAANNKIIPLIVAPGQYVGLQYIAVAASATVTDGATLKMICSD